MEWQPDGPGGAATAPSRGRSPAARYAGRLRHRRGAVARVLLATLCVSGIVAAAATSGSGTAGAATLDGVATTASPGTTTYLSSGGSNTLFTVFLPPQAACSGDSATNGFRVFSYLVQAGTDVTTITFPGGQPNFGANQYGLIESDGNFWEDQNTAPTTGQIIGIPNDFQWEALITKGLALDSLLHQSSNTSGVWESGIACTNGSGVVTDYWNTQLTFSANGGDPNGFVWSAVPGPAGSQVPAFTSANHTTFTQGTHGSFTPTAAGTPAPTITEQGTLPTGVTFTSGAISGTPTQSGSFPITFAASNGIGPPVQQPFTLTVNPAAGAPTVTNVSPGGGPPSGGTTVTVTGTAFTGATAVHFGANAGTGLVVNSDTSITIVSPAGTPGTTVDVTVTTPAGTSANTSADHFTYGTVPVVTSVAPPVGTPAGGTTVTVGGVNFTGATAVHFGANAGTGLVVNSDTSITIVSPAGSPGTVDVTVTTPSGTSTTGSADHFTYEAAPTVTAVAPTSGSTAGGTPVTLTGTGFTGATAVHFGANAGTGLVVNSSTSLSVNSPAGSAGVVDVTVTTPVGTSATSSADHFTYVAPPTVSNVSPAGGPPGGGTAVTVTGTGFTGATAVHFGANAGTGLVVNSDTSISINSPAGTSGATVDVTVTAPGGTSATTSADHFTYGTAPTVSSVAPAAGLPAGGTSVTVTGTGFTGATAVHFGANAGTGLVVNSATSISVNSPAGSAGTTVDVTVTTPTGGTSATTPADHFTYETAPTVTGVSPAAGSTAGGTPVTVTGTNFTAATAVDFGATAGTSLVVNSATSLTVRSPAASAGAVDVTVTTPVGTSTTGPADQFTYVTPPGVTNVSPSQGPAAGGTAVTVTGTNLTGATAVHFGASVGTGLVVNSATSISVISPPGSGSVHVTVTTAGGTSATSSADLYLYLVAPSITSAASTTFTEGTPGSFTVTATGSPAPTLTESGSLPAGVSFTGNQLTGTPSQAGNFSITFTAQNGVSPNATQSFTLTVTVPNTSSSSLPAPAVGIAANPSGTGYWVADAAGDVHNHGAAANYGSLTGLPLNAPIVHIVATVDGGGYWLVAGDGGVFALGDAPFYGSTGALHLNAPVVGIVPTADGHGYWLVASDGGVFAFGDAVFHGSMGGLPLNKPIVGGALDPATGGYWLVASDGGIFSFAAPFYGSLGSLVLNQPVNGMAVAPAGRGYWLVASDGGIFAVNAPFRGSAVGIPGAAPVVGMATCSATGGYWLLGSGGGVYSFGAPFYGAG